MTKMIKAFRAAGMFLGNFATAMLGTTLVVAPLHYLPRPHSAPAILLREDILSAVCAFGLGYIAYLKWKSESAKWLWTVGTFIFLLGAFHISQRAGGTLFFEVTGRGPRNDAANLLDWSVYTLLFVRTVSYSLGAVCCWLFARDGTHSRASARPTETIEIKG
jgi:hypothetical protein